MESQVYTVCMQNQSVSKVSKKCRFEVCWYLRKILCNCTVLCSCAIAQYCVVVQLHGLFEKTFVVILNLIFKVVENWSFLYCIKVNSSISYWLASIFLSHKIKPLFKLKAITVLLQLTCCICSCKPTNMYFLCLLYLSFPSKNKMSPCCMFY